MKRITTFILLFAVTLSFAQIQSGFKGRGGDGTGDATQTWVLQQISDSLATVSGADSVFDRAVVGTGTWTGDERLAVNQSGAKTNNSYAQYITNTSTSSTASKNKFGVRVSSTGTWNGSSATNYGLYVDPPTGGTNNIATYLGGKVGIGLVTNPQHYISMVDINANSPGLNIVNSTYNVKYTASAAAATDTASAAITVPSGLPQLYMANATGQNGTFGYTAGADYFNIVGAGLSIGSPTSPSSPLVVVGINVMPIEQYRYSTDASSAGFIAYKARGTLLSPSQVLANDALMGISCKGYTNSGAFSAHTVGFFAMYAGDAFTNSSQPTYMTWSTTSTGATYHTERMRLNSSGYFGIGTNNPQTYLHVSQNPSSTNTIVSNLRIERLTSGTAAAGLGASTDTYLEDTAGNSEQAITMSTDWTTATDGSETSRFAIGLRNNGAAVPAVASSQFQITGAGALSATGSISAGTSVSANVGYGFIGSSGGNAGNITIGAGSADAYYNLYQVGQAGFTYRWGYHRFRTDYTDVARMDSSGVGIWSNANVANTDFWIKSKHSTALDIASPDAQLITNTVDRDFSGAGNWDLAAGSWVVSGGVLTHVTGNTNNATLTSTYMTSGTVSGEYYEFRCRITDVTGGNIIPYLGSVPIFTIGVGTATGAAKVSYYNVVVKCADNNASIIFTPSVGTFTGSVDNVSLRKLSSKFTVNRAGTVVFGSNTKMDNGSKALVDGVATGLFSIALPTLSQVGGRIGYTIYCADAGVDTMLTYTGEVCFSASNKAASYVTNISEVTTGSAVVSNPAGASMTDTWTITTGTNLINILCNANPVIDAGYTMTIKWNLYLHDTATVTKL